MPSIRYRWPYASECIVDCEVLAKLDGTRYRIRYEEPYVSEQLTVEVERQELIWPRFSELVY